MKTKLSSLLLLCFMTVVALPIYGQDSPCDFDGIHPFCTDQNPMGITYSSGVSSNPYTTSNATANFLGANRAGCCSSLPSPAWFYMKIATPGNITININQTSGDVDFCCWGPFPTTDVSNFLTNLCNGTYQLYTGSGTSNHSGGSWPQGGTGGVNNIPMADCCYCTAATEQCHINNAQPGQIYLLVMTNYANNPGSISFNRTSTSTATTDCSVLEQIEDNSPLCEGQTLMLTYPETNPLPSLTYTWICPDGYSTTTTTPSFDRQNVTVAMGGRYKLIRRVGNNVGDTIFSADIDVTLPTASRQRHASARARPSTLLLR